MMFINFIKGIIIGIATLVPGVSGGTMAIILGVYNEMIASVSSFFKDIKKNIIFLGVISIGGVLGILLFSKMIDYLLVNYNFITIYFFLGIIVGGLRVIYKEINDNKKKKGDFLYFLIGLSIILLMSFNVGTIVNLAASTGILKYSFLFIVGIIIAVALILPGISTSFILLALGLYKVTIEAINNLDLSYLIPLVLGVLAGVILTTKILEKLLNNKPRETYLLILGFVLGSIAQVFPGFKFNIEMIMGILLFIIGYKIMQYLTIKFKA